MPQTALIITHASSVYDKSEATKGNILEFIAQNPQMDVIRLNGPLDDDYIGFGKVLKSDFGELSEDNAKRIVSAYGRIVTAGGDFSLCAFRTYNSLLSAYFQDNKNPLEIIVPLSLFYIQEMESGEVYSQKSSTVDKLIMSLEGSHQGRMNWHLMHRNIQLNSIAKEARTSQGHSFSYCTPDVEFVAQNNGLKFVGLMSHEQLE